MENWIWRIRRVTEVPGWRSLSVKIWVVCQDVDGGLVLCDINNVGG